MSLLLKIYVMAVTAISIAGLIYVYVKPLPSMRVDGDGLPHLTSAVLHAETGEPVPLGSLMRHYRGD